MSSGRLRVLDEDVEVPVVVEDARVEQLVLELFVATGCRFVSTRSPYGNARCGYLYRYFMYECVGVLSR